MSKSQRNAPCPCGSGKKYKKCCLDNDAAALTERRRLHHREKAQFDIEREQFAARFRDGAGDLPIGILEYDPLDDISNSVLDLIREENLEEALCECDVLLDDHPEVIDGLERSGLVHAAMGEHNKAAGFYERCLDFIARRPDGFDSGSVEYYEGRLAEMKRLAASS